VQCARKTEIALWPYLFSMAGKPKDLFQQCITQNQLEIAASYLIILQNLEPSSVSRQYATMLLDTALEQKKWDLAKDLVRFLRAIDPNDVESPRTSFVLGSKFGMSSVQSSLHPNPEELSLILGNNITRGRSFSTTPQLLSKQLSDPKSESSIGKDKDKEKVVVSSVGSSSQFQKNRRRQSQAPKEKVKIVEDFFIEEILQRHATKLLQSRKLEDLGVMAAKLDFHLVNWLSREKDRSGKIDDFVTTLKQLHEETWWPKPSVEKTKVLVHDTSGSAQTPQSDTSQSQVESGYISNSHDIDHFPGYLQKPQKMMPQMPSSKYASNLEMEANLLPKIDLISVASEQVSLWDEDKPNFLQFDLEDQRFHNAIEERKKSEKSKMEEQKTEIKLRYLLQLFNEGDCLEFSLLLSIMLQDGASISRITNKAIRSNSLILCRKLRNGMKDITRWSLYEW
jgi:hypothetical protein